MNTNIFRENLDLSEATIDNENRVLKNVILIREGMTLNKHYYSEPVLQKAAPLFEGVKAYDSHKLGVPRQVSEITGWYSNVRYEGGALRGDRYFSRTRAGEDVLAVAEDIVSGRAPRSLAGLSINAIGTGKTKKFDQGEALNVESITAATSVDDVTIPAGGGMYLSASASGDELLSHLLNSLDYREWVEARPEFASQHTREVQKVRENERIKASKDDANQAKLALQEAQATVTSLTEQNTKLLADIEAVRRELVLEKTLNKVQLPASWKVSLREQLTKADPQEWEGIVEREIEKSKMGAKRIEVTGAGQQVAESIVESVKPTRTHPNWDVILASPENFNAWKAQLG